MSLEHRPHRIILVPHGEPEGNLDDTIYNPANAQPVVLPRQPDCRYKLERPFTQWNSAVVPTERERSGWL